MGLYIPDVVTFINCDDTIAEYGDDPRLYLKFGNKYKVLKVKIIGGWTFLKLEGFPLQNFNSVCFPECADTYEDTV